MSEGGAIKRILDVMLQKGKLERAHRGRKGLWKSPCHFSLIVRQLVRGAALQAACRQWQCSLNRFAIQSPACFLSSNPSFQKAKKLAIHFFCFAINLRTQPRGLRQRRKHCAVFTSSSFPSSLSYLSVPGNRSRNSQGRHGVIWA